MAAAQRKFGMEPGVLVYCPCVDGELVVACPLEALASEALCAELSGKQVRKAAMHSCVIRGIVCGIAQNDHLVSCWCSPSF